MTQGGTLLMHRLRWCTIAGGRFTLLLAALLLTTLTSEAHRLPPPQRADNGPIVQKNQSLEQGKPVERKLGGGEAHAYQLTLTLDQFARFVADQRGIDVALTLFDPNGNKIREVNDRWGERGLEVASLVANLPGVYRIEVRSIRKTDPLGSYQIDLERLHSANDQDRATN